jgi:hypothetical protein
VLIEHHPLRSSRIGRIKPLETHGGRVAEEHSLAGHGSAQGLPRPSHGWHHRDMDDATCRHWEELADRCFDRAYLAALRQVTPKPANG